MSERPAVRPANAFPLNKETPKVTSLPRNRAAALAVGALALLLALISAPAAGAAPSLAIDLSHTPETTQRNDEWLGYSFKVSNAALPAPNVGPGDTLTCASGAADWNPAPATGAGPTFSFEWRRNGEAIAGANEDTYTLAPADAGKALQCVVTGTNMAGKATFASLNPVVVDPRPVIAPPSSENPKAEGSRSTIEGADAEPRTCQPPTNWLPKAPETPPVYHYQWLRNSEPISGATSAGYTPGSEDDGKNLQCEAIGETAGGKAVVISEISPVNSVGFPPRNEAALAPSIPDLNATQGPVEVELELPGGLETEVTGLREPAGSARNGVSADEVGGWLCVAQKPSGSRHARLHCQRPDSLAPQSSYPEILVEVGFGADAPEPTMEALASVSGGGFAVASDSDLFEWSPAVPFGLISFETKVADELGADYTQAGGHPTVASESFAFNHHQDPNNVLRSTERVKNANTETPPGFVGSATATPELCQSVEEVEENTCPAGSVVGGIDTSVGPPYNALVPNLPIYALEPEYGAPAQFAFAIGGIKSVYTITPELRPEDNYAISLNPAPIVNAPSVLTVTARLCGFGAKRVGSGADAADEFTGARFAGCKGPTDADANPTPLITNPTRCSGPPPTTKLVVNSWEHPENKVSAVFSSPALTGCDAVRFEPSVTLKPTSPRADSPTGIDAEITMPTDGLTSRTGISQANLNTATVTLPKGMSVNPALAGGLGACAPSEIKLKTNAAVECPESSKIGTAEVQTPILREALVGDVYVAQQNANPFKSLLSLYLVFESKKDGLLIKVAGKVVPDPVTGQLTTVFTENPQAPFSRIALHIASGDRAPLINPPACGSYGIESRLSPWSAADPANPTPAETVTATSTFEVTSGPKGGPCPSGGLDPKLNAGVKGTKAGATSPFVMDLSREDGTQRFSALDLAMPKGLTAYLKGIPYCPDSVLAGISSAEETGRPQIANPSCPAASQLGTASAGAGAGPYPFYVDTGRVYLAGPYKGAPLSLAIVTPAVAGPFDLGNIVVRAGAYVDPETAQITVKSDPIPAIVHGLLLDVRDIRVNVDRSHFVLNPTNCEPMSVAARVKGESGGSATVSNRFQVGECAALAFKPTLITKVFGGTKRGRNPRFRATLTAKPGEANIGRTAVTLPHSEFLDQSHIRTICTRVQFAAHNCPRGSIYGHAKAFSPLLDYPLTGPVYLRSSNNPLPDLVAALRGPDYQPLEVDLVGRIDSVHGGIRNTFESVPDAPVSKFVLDMKGGKKGLLVNSRDLCKSVNRSTVRMTGQNGKAHNFRPVLKNDCRKHRKHGKRKHPKKKQSHRTAGRSQ